MWLNPLGKKVSGEKGKAAYSISPNDDKTNVTMLFTICADGSFIAPYVLHKGKRIPKGKAVSSYLLLGNVVVHQKIG